MDQAARLRELMQGQKKQSQEKSMKLSPNDSAMQIITIASGKGGVGKSNFAANLALSLQRLGKRVVILDADFGFANIDVILNVSTRKNFVDLVTKQKNIEEVLTVGPLGVRFISGVYDVFKLSQVEEESVHHLINSFNELAQIADVLIIDTGAGLQESALRFMRVSNDIIIVTTPEPTAITDAYSLLKSIISANLIDSQNLSFMVNMADDDQEAKEVYQRLGSAVKRFLRVNIDFLGFVPYDRHIIQSVKAREPVTIHAPKCKASQAIYGIAKTFVNTDKVIRKKSIGSFVRGLLGM